MNPAFVRSSRNALLYTLVVILWGAFVRASGSGAGCGDHWPLCEGSIIPDSPAMVTLIELFHRATSGLSLIFVGLVFARARRLFQPSHPARKAALAAFVIIIIEALIGAVIVRASLFGENASLARAALIGVHFINTLLLLATQTLTVYWGAQPPETAAQPAVHPAGGLRLLFVVGVIGWLALGASGAIGALSRSLYPADSLAEALTREFSADAPLLLRLRSAHPVLAALMGIHLCALAWIVNKRIQGQLAHRLAISMTALFFAQCLLGMLNVLAVLPTPVLQLAHLLLMDVLWICFVLLAMYSLSPQATGAQPAVAARLATGGVLAQSG
jgi:heme A synthase